jgi:predicted permease
MRFRDRSAPFIQSETKPSSFRQPQFDEEMSAELASYRDLLADAKIREGFPVSEAQREAVIEIGGIEQAKEQIRSSKSTYHLECIWSDLRYAARALRRSFIYSLATTALVALIVTATAVLFSVATAFWSKNLPYPNAGDLVLIQERVNGYLADGTSFASYMDWRSRQTVFDEIAACAPAGGVLLGGLEPEYVSGHSVTASLFRTLSVPPEFGRGFTDQDDRPEAAPVVVITHQLWDRHFAGAKDVVGKTLLWNGQEWTVIGVMPSAFENDRRFRGSQVLVPLGRLSNQFYMKERLARSIFVLGRLRAGVGRREASVQMTQIAREIESEFPATSSGTQITLRPILAEDRAALQHAIKIPFIAVALVFAIGCGSAANLILARMAMRLPELMLRVALGATRTRIVRPVILELAMIIAAGGVIGACCALVVLAKIVPITVPGMLPLKSVMLDARAIVATCGAIMIVGGSACLWSLIPAFRGMQQNILSAQRITTHATVTIRAMLLATQIAITVALLLGAALLLQSYRRLIEVRPGFNSKGVVTFHLRLPDTKYADASQATGFVRQFTAALSNSDGVLSVCAATEFPLSLTNWEIPKRDKAQSTFGQGPYFLQNRLQPSRLSEWPLAAVAEVTPEYHATLGIPLIAGRYLSHTDGAATNKVVLVDEGLARCYFPSQPQRIIGQKVRIRGRGGMLCQIVGVVASVKQHSLEEPDTPIIYQPWSQLEPEAIAVVSRDMDYLIKSSDSPNATIATVERVLHSVDADLPVSDVASLETLLKNSTAERRTNATLLMTLSVIVTALAVSGLYGLVDYLVIRRSRDIAIRIALGATRLAITRSFFREGFIAIVGGMTSGVLAALVLRSTVADALYGVTATEPRIYAVVLSSTLVVMITGCALPAFRATRINVVRALRCE